MCDLYELSCAGLTRASIPLAKDSIENATGYRQEGMDPRVKPAGDADDRETLNRNQLENALEFV
jgi:hypothetical protein